MNSYAAGGLSVGAAGANVGIKDDAISVYALLVGNHRKLHKIQVVTDFSLIV
jgi:hypothetical protein